jgi:tRNA(Ile)-lysidine synthase
VERRSDPAHEGRGVVAQVREAVLGGGLLSAGRPIVVMLSGGRDSVCLLDVTVDLCGADLLRALHVNYGLREEADAEERHCERLCERLGVPLEVVRAERAPGNVQAWAREIRYQAALRVAEELDERIARAREGGGMGVGKLDSGERDARAHTQPTALVAAGHTATDQVETILYRLAASPGRRALLGMPAREGRVVRPLLGVTREQTAAYCVERGLEWREDASNDSDAYARSRVRHGLLPALRAVHPAAERNVLRTAELLRQETELLDQLVDAELAGETSIAIDRMGELHPALARLVVVRLAEQAAGPGVYVPQAGDRVKEILELAGRQGRAERRQGHAERRHGRAERRHGRAERRHGRAELHIGGLLSAVIEDGRLRMVKIAPHYPSPGRD